RTDVNVGRGQRPVAQFIANKFVELQSVLDAMVSVVLDKNTFRAIERFHRGVGGNQFAAAQDERTGPVEEDFPGVVGPAALREIASQDGGGSADQQPRAQR